MRSISLSRIRVFLACRMTSGPCRCPPPHPRCLWMSKSSAVTDTRSSYLLHNVLFCSSLSSLSSSPPVTLPDSHVDQVKKVPAKSKQRGLISDWPVSCRDVPELCSWHTPCTPSPESFDFAATEGPSQPSFLSFFFWFRSAGRRWTAGWGRCSETPGSCVRWLWEVRPSDKCRQWWPRGMWSLGGGLPGWTTLQWTPAAPSLCHLIPLFGSLESECSGGRQREWQRWKREDQRRSGYIGSSKRGGQTICKGGLEPKNKQDEGQRLKS